MDLGLLEAAASVGTAIATIALVFLLYRTIKQMEATVHLSRVQTEYRFRPWVGPSNSINESEKSINGKRQFEIGIKNYGEIPAEYVNAYFKLSNSFLSKNDIKIKDLECFNLGPLLPNMEKHYWFFIDSELLQKAKDGAFKFFTIIYFEYPVSGGKSGYGMISEYNPKTNEFIHKEMWVDTPSGKTIYEKRKI